MKRLLTMIAAVMMPLIAGAQAQITTKKVKIGDFTQKITKVVLTGNEFYDGTLKDEIAAGWRVSPYEFCTLGEFDSLRGNDSYYFLLTTKGQFRRETEPGLQFLTLVKGGKDADKGIDEMLEIVSLPISSAEDPSGREIVFFPAFLDIIQNYALDSMEKDVNAYTGLGNYTSNIYKSDGMRIVFSESDLSKGVTDEVKAKYLDEPRTGMTVMDEDDADGLIGSNADKTLVSYTAAPTEPVNGSFCYKMLIDSGTHKLYYFRKHRISAKTGSGFLPEDIKRISDFRK